MNHDSRTANHADIHQSKMYADYMRAIGWTVESIEGVNAFIKKIPFAGTVIKIQRPNKIPSEKALNLLKEKYHARSISIEPGLAVIPDLIRDLENKEMLKRVQHDKLAQFQYLKEPYLPTKTIHIDLHPSEETIFKSFTEAKRRAVRRAEKNKIIVTQSTNIQDFIRLKNKSAGLLGFLTTTTVKPLFETFNPDHAAVLCAYKENNKNPVATVLLLFYEKTAYYWQAAASSEGKKLAAPTLLVWEALKLAKSKKCVLFDFEGIFDPRYPNLNKNWSGFTKFKQGFGGVEVEFPKPIVLS